MQRGARASLLPVGNRIPPLSPFPSHLKEMYIYSDDGARGNSCLPLSLSMSRPFFTPSFYAYRYLPLHRLLYTPTSPLPYRSKKSGKKLQELEKKNWEEKKKRQLGGPSPCASSQAFFSSFFFFSHSKCFIIMRIQAGFAPGYLTKKKTCECRKKIVEHFCRWHKQKKFKQLKKMIFFKVRTFIYHAWEKKNLISFLNLLENIFYYVLIGWSCIYK